MLLIFIIQEDPVPKSPVSKQNKAQETPLPPGKITSPSDFRHQVPDPTSDLQTQKGSIPPILSRAWSNNGVSDPKGSTHNRADPVILIAYLLPPARGLDTYHLRGHDLLMQRKIGSEVTATGVSARF